MKLRVLFAVELQEASQSGLCNKRLWRLVADLMSVWHTNTQEVEGVNSIIKKIVQLAPNVSWKVLAARISIKKGCGCMAPSRSSEEAFIQNCVATDDQTRD
eukprot:3374723-Lingulodinium_polyedra.AAC.1